jgi:glycosidase
MQGFSEGTPTWLPLNQNYKNGINVEDQERGFSHLNIYRALIQMRKTSAFSLGGLQTVVLNDNKVFSMAR